MNIDRELKRIRKKLSQKEIIGIKVSPKNDSVLLTGIVDNWTTKIEAGFVAAKRGFRGVINNIEVQGIKEKPMNQPHINDSILQGRHFDGVIVGGGVIGSAIARELSKKNITIALLEKEPDLAMQASGRNDGMIHPGFAASTGTLKARYNVRGNRMYTQWAEELDFEFRRPGTIILFSDWWYSLLTPILKSRCKKNGVDGNYRRLSAKEVRKLEPNVSVKQKGGFLLPSSGIVSPYKVTIALAENAVQNGAEVFLNTAVTSIERDGNKITKINTNRGNITCGVLINAAGVWSDKLAELAGDHFFSIHGRKGTDAILDRDNKTSQNFILGMPTLLGHKKNHTKGGGVIPCIEGNILLGPTAQEVPDREDYSTDPLVFSQLLDLLDLNKKLHSSQIINYYSGIRAANYDEDFIIEASNKVSNLVHAAAIQSPGLASAPAIAEDIALIVVDILNKTGKEVKNRDNFNPIRKDIPLVRELSSKDRNELIIKDPAYGEILCRCEEVSRGEIRDALKSRVPATTVDGIKRRVRAGAGRCHGGFCLPKVIITISKELGVPVTSITKKGGVSTILTSRTKEDISK